MNIAYLVLTYKDPQLLSRMVSSLEDTGDFYVYVDKKTSVKPFIDIFKNHKNVIFISKRRNISWGGWSIVQSYLDLLCAAFNNKKVYDRFVMLTGQDYPLYHNKRIVETFQANRETEYIMAYNIAHSPLPSDRHKITKKWFLDSPFKNCFLTKCYKAIMYYTITKPFSSNKIKLRLNNEPVEPYFGQMLCAFTRQAAELLINTYKYDKKFNRQMKYVHAPDELYWQTIIFNSPLRKNTIQKGEEHEITEHFGWAPLHYLTYLENTSEFTSPDDFRKLVNSNFMFCRKVYSDKSEKLLDLIDEYRKQKDNT